MRLLFAEDDRDISKAVKTLLERSGYSVDVVFNGQDAIDYIESGEYAAYCCVWVHLKTDYAYIEPVCTVPDHRGKGLAKAVIYEALNRAKSFGAKNAFVISDTSFYERLGFRKDRHFTFYWKW